MSSYRSVQTEIFWSYKKWLAGNEDMGREIMANIAMFVPFGFLTAAVYPLSDRRSGTNMPRTVVVMAAAALFSLTIETLQLFLMRGLFEWDDLVSNTGGALIGLLLYLTLEKLLRDKSRTVTLFIGVVFAAVCLVVLTRGPEIVGAEADATSKNYCFQIEDAAAEGSRLQLSGFAFRYGQPTDRYSLFLRSTETGRKTKLETECGLPRKDVNDYFSCEYDYTNVGFLAGGEMNADEEYELVIQWPWSPSFSTGVFVTGTDIHYFPEESWTEPAIQADFVTDGIPRVYRPDYHCWVYQYQGALYWVVDEDFNFEEDGKTYIQYQMWTTQIEKLPEKRLANENFWDNIGGYFEKYEIDGEFGSYRVMRREIPTAYSVTSIVTGYYKNGNWIWRNYFRPYY